MRSWIAGTNLFRPSRTRGSCTHPARYVPRRIRSRQPLASNQRLSLTGGSRSGQTAFPYSLPIARAYHRSSIAAMATTKTANVAQPKVVQRRKLASSFKASGDQAN